MPISRKWKSDAAKTASALPFVNASLKCSILPAPPDAMTGMLTLSETARVSSRSYPAFVPSPIHARQQNFTRAEFLRALCPFYGVNARVHAAAV